MDSSQFASRSSPTIGFFGEGLHLSPNLFASHHHHRPSHSRSPSRSSRSAAADSDAASSRWPFDQLDHHHLVPPESSSFFGGSQYGALSSAASAVSFTVSECGNLDLNLDLDLDFDMSMSMEMDPTPAETWSQMEISGGGGAPSPSPRQQHTETSPSSDDVITSDWVQVSRPRPRSGSASGSGSGSGSFLRSTRSSDGGYSSSPPSAGLTPQSLAGPASGDHLTVHMDITRASSSRQTSTIGSPAGETPNSSSASESTRSAAITPGPPLTPVVAAFPSGSGSGPADESTKLGPCSRVWDLPPRIRRRKKEKPPASASSSSSSSKRPSKRQRSDNASEPREGPKRRGAYTDETKKRNTALTRILKSCIRCRMNRGRCHPDELDPYGPCLTCKSITGPTLCKMPCYRYIITDASLYREQRAPYQVYSKRWQSMDIIDIPSGDWASPEIKWIVVSPNHLRAPFRFAVRKFHPVEGDLLQEQWMTPQGKRTIPIPPYAVADMHATAAAMKEYVERNISNFILSSVGNEDLLLWETYTMAFRHIGNAKTPEERSLLSNTFRLWVICRLISNPVHICGDEKLGGQAVQSQESLHDGKVPMPMIMTAQFECINYTTFLRPWSKAVLKQLNELVLAKRRDYWLTIYFAMFVLLHSCAMMTRRDEETAVQYEMNGRYANPESIRAHHSGAQTMLAHFHFINKGVVPFSLPHNVAGKQELAKAANLTDEQVSFVWRTATLAHDPERVARMRYVRERGMVGHDLYWVSMLFDKEWVPQRME